MNGSPSKKWTPPADAQPIMTTDPEKKPWAPPSEAIPVEQVKKKEDTESVPASGNGTTGQTSVDGSKPSESGTPPTEKPTARAKLKSRVQDLSKLYQNKFQEGLQPFLDTQQKEYEGAINSKKTELEALVGSGKLNVEDANSQLKEFSTVKKGEFDKKINNQQALESDKFNKLHGKEISKWLNLYNDEYYKEDFQENKITNPAESFGKTAWSTFTQDIPSSIYAARALGRSAKGKVDQQIANAFDKIGIPKINGEDAEHVFSQALKFITGATDEQIAKSFEVKAETMDASNKKLVVDDLQAATELSNASAESKKYLINNLDKVKTGDWLDTMNYVASAAGQGAGQIPASIGTRGTTSLIQEMGGIYLDSVNKIAQESELSIEEVIKQGKDDVVFPIVFGLGAGLLDAYGANKVSGAFSKKQVLDSFRKRAVALAKTSGYETITEGAQGALEEIGVNKATGKTWVETFNAIDPDIIKESAIQGGIAGLFLGGAGQVVQKGITAMAPKIQPLKAQEVKTTNEVIEDQKNVVDTTNPESVKQAAETIQNKFNEHTDTDKSQPIQEGVEKNVQQSVQQKADTQEPATISGGMPAGDQSNIQQAGNTSISEKPITDDKGTYDFSGVRQQLSASQEATPEQQNPEATAGETLNTEDNGQNQRNEGNQEGLLDSTSKQAGQHEDLEQPASTLKDVDQKAGSIVPRNPTVDAMVTDTKVEGIKNTLVQAGKITTDAKGDLTVKQNSGAPSQLFKDLEQITGNKSSALNDYLNIKDDNGDFKKKFGDWENSIMKDYGRAGHEYKIKTGTPENADPSSFAWVNPDDKGNPVITFNPEKVKKGADFQSVKEDYAQEVDKQGSEEYRKLYDQTINKLRDLKLHLIHQALIEKQKGSVSTEDNIRSLKEIDRLNHIELAKDYYGEPMVFMHSGAQGIQKFLKPGDAGYTKNDKYTGTTGIYFSRDTDSAKRYAKFQEEKPGEGKDLYYVFLKTKNPYYLTDPRAQAEYPMKDSMTLTEKDQQALEKLGYDSVIWDKEGAPKHEMVVFHPDQVEIIGSYRKGMQGSDAGRYEFKRPIQPPPPTTPDKKQSSNPSKGERATIIKLQDQSKLSDALKEGIEDFKDYTVKKQSRSREQAQKYIKRVGEDQALQDAISFKFARPQEEKMALLSELAEQFSSKFKAAEKEGNQEKVDQYYSKFMTTMNTLSNLITDTAQALSYLNLVGTVFETKTGALRFAKNQIEQSREGAMKNYQEMKMTAEQLIKEFDKLPTEDFLKSKQVQDLIAKMRNESPKSNKIRQADKKVKDAADRLRDVWNENKNLGAIYDPKSQAEKDVKLTKALIAYVKAVIEKIAAEAGEFVKNISQQATDSTKKFIKEVGLDVSDDALAEIINPEVEEFQRSTRYTKPITPAEREQAVTTIRNLLLPSDGKSGNRNISDKPAIQEFYERLVKRIITNDVNKTTRKPIDVLSEVLRNIDKYADVLNDVRDELQANGIDTSDIDNIFKLPFFEKALRKNENVIDAYKLVNEHYSNLDKIKGDLAKKLIDQYGLSGPDAINMEKALDKLRNEYLTKEKQKLVNRFTPKSRKPNKKRQEFYDKVIKLSNTGAVSDQQLEDAIANIFGLPEMTPQIASKIEDMVEDINKAPEGRFKNIAITKLTDYIAIQQKFNITDYMQASFRAGIFSGIDTQALNLLGNFFNVMEMGFMLSMVNPKAAARFIGSVRNPTSLSRAGLEALEIIKTGYDPRVAGDAKRRVLEQSPRTLFGFGKGLKGWKQALDPTLEQQKKYVFRALSAGDILFSQGINDALQQEMYARAAKEQGLKGSEAKAYVREKMGFTPEKIDASLQKAVKEAKDGAIPQNENSISLRAKEIIEQQRDPDVIEKSREYAQEQILTNTPKGYIGIIARGLNSMIQQLPVLSALIPVVNFAANAMQRAVQFLPPAALTRGAAHYTQRIIQGENLSTIIKDDINRLKSGDLEQEMRLRRFAAGTVSLIMLAALLDDDDDGDNLLSKAVGKTVKIHGSGPGTKLNRQKTYQKQETGYLPYSVQIGDTYIPYKNYPGLNVLLSTFGEYQDAKRYGKLDKKDALNRMVFAVCNSFAVISEMGFLTSLNTTTQAFLEANPKEFTSLVTRPVGGLLFPKFQRNLLNFFDDQVYSGRDVQEIAIRSIPVLNTAAGDPLLNALGENVERNWWDRIELWNSKSYTDHKPIWDANMKNNYYIPVPSKASLEDVFDKPLTTSEYNKFFKLRGEEIIKNFTPDMLALKPDDYARKMDAIVEFGKYKALVQMGAMDSDLMKEIKFQLYDLYDTKRESQELKKQIKP